MQEIWVRVLEETDEETVMDFISNMADECLGDIPVVLCCFDRQKPLPFAYACSENAMPVLQQRFGNDCVKRISKGTINDSLERIAMATERIAKSLEKLADCTGNTQGYGRRLYIAGDSVVCNL